MSCSVLTLRASRLAGEAASFIAVALRDRPSFPTAQAGIRRVHTGGRTSGNRPEEPTRQCASPPPPGTHCATRNVCIWAWNTVRRYPRPGRRCRDGSDNPRLCATLRVVRPGSRRNGSFSVESGIRSIGTSHRWFAAGRRDPECSPCRPDRDHSGSRSVRRLEAWSSSLSSCGTSARSRGHGTPGTPHAGTGMPARDRIWFAKSLSKSARIRGGVARIAGGSCSRWRFRRAGWANPRTLTGA
jgi:hypothetical protein